MWAYPNFNFNARVSTKHFMGANKIQAHCEHYKNGLPAINLKLP
jgi:hypothetical protein